ncbi:unnamed protein product [Thelazia callipaeda]|uniref:Gamma-tubulin complex component n=1 Tax=Thelazia callipaeda TaxID=103827 RepID=A0A0N5CT37_THECL|nr:unnamed protein product [Thelazia callipaeda]
MVDVFHECLTKWLIYGKLIDPGFRWMIEVESKWTVEQNWTNRFKIREESVPLIFEHFEGLEEKIFFVGKTVALMEQLNMEDDDLHNRLKIFSSVNHFKCYVHINAGNCLHCAVKKLSVRIKSKVYRNILQKYDFQAHILAIERHYLLDDEIFALTFYEKLREKTIGDSMLKLNSHQLSDSFRAAMQKCNTWPFEISQYASIEATCGLMKEFTDVLDSSRLVSSPRDLRGFAAIRLNYKAKIPISIVLNERYSDLCHSSRLVSSPRDLRGFAAIRLNYKAKIPISIVLNERYSDLCLGTALKSRNFTIESKNETVVIPTVLLYNNAVGITIVYVPFTI